jgi:sulfatase modifying factor 1
MRLWSFIPCCALLVACSGGADDDPEQGSGRGLGTAGRSGADDVGMLGDRPDGGGGSLLPLGGATGTADGGVAAVDAGGADPGSGTTDAGAGEGGSSAGGAGGGGGGGEDCEADTHRCTDAGRERCDDTGWVSDPCPLDTPACDAGECVLRGPEMLRVGAFYIDSTEVTVADYIEFLDVPADERAEQPEVCAWNTAFYDGDPLEPDDWPINYVDWCDAWSYCDWAGKRLCGARDGGAVAPDDALNQDESQWFLACGGPGGGSHPNDDPVCNSSGGFGSLEPVASNAGCEGHYPGLFDMEGNAAEWVDSCAAETGASDSCMLLGGSYVQNQSYCTAVPAEYSRDTTAHPFGFRCCSG